MQKKSIVIPILFVLIIVLASIQISAISRSRFSNFGNFSFTELSNNYNITLINYSAKMGLYYKFDNQSSYGENGSLAYDFSGNGRNATLYGDVINTTLAKYNYSANVDGINYNISLSTYTISDGTSYTINFWFRRIGWGPSNWQAMIGESGNTVNFIGFNSAGTFRFDNSNNTLPTSYILPDKTWVMVTVSCFDSTAINRAKFYINGTLLGYTDSAICDGYKINSLTSAFTNLRVIGNIDELAVWETNLEDSQVAELYENTYPEFESQGNYSQIFTSFNSNQNVSLNTPVKWRSTLQGNSSINVYACVGNNYENCRLQQNGLPINISDNSSNVKIIAQLIADPSNLSNWPYLEMLEPPKISFYVDNSSSTCTNSNTLFGAMNSSKPFCTISSADNFLESDSEMIINSGSYCEGISVTVSGDRNYPIIIRGNDSSEQTFLNGTCASEVNGLSVNGYNYINFQNFEIYNFSNDAGNVGSTSQDINFQNILARDNGYAQTSASGDCISFHVNSSSSNSSDISCTGNYKSAIVDIQNTNTNYSNIYSSNNRLYGIFFYGEGSGEGSTPNNISYHFLRNATILNSPGCYWSEVSSDAEEIYCTNITGKGIYLANRNNSVTNFNVLTNNGTSLKILNSFNYSINLTNGYLNENISIINSSNIILTNVSYNENLISLDSNSKIERLWYLTLGSTQEGTNITVKNSSNSIIYSETTSTDSLVFNPKTFLGHINNGGNITNETLTITASKSGYTSESLSLILSDNRAINFTLDEISTESSSGSSSSGGETVNFKISPSSIQNGISRTLRENWAINTTIKNNSHSIYLKKINSESADLVLFSEPKNFNVMLNETKKFDLDEDGFYDLEIKLVKINSKFSIEIYLKEINESYSLKEDTLENDNPLSMGDDIYSNNSSKILLIILLIILVSGIILFKRKKF